MKTKYGEIKSIRDLVEKTGEERILNPTASASIQIILMKVKCKICGDILEIQDSRGCVSYSGDTPTYGDNLEKHIELHKTIKSII